MFRILRFLSLVIIVVTCLSVSAETMESRADFTLTISDGVGDTATFNASGSAVNGIVNSYNFVSSTGNVGFSSGILYIGGNGTSANNLFKVTDYTGTGGTSSIDLSSVNIYSDSSNSTGNTITFVLSGNGFSSNGPGVALTSTVNASVVGSGGGTINYQSYIDSGGTVYTSAPGVGGTVSTSGPQGGVLPPSYDNTVTSVIYPFSSSNYSLTNVTSWSPTSSGTEISWDNSASVSTVPVPGSLYLLASGLPVVGLGFYWERHRKLFLVATA